MYLLFLFENQKQYYKQKMYFNILNIQAQSQFDSQINDLLSICCSSCTNCKRSQLLYSTTSPQSYPKSSLTLEYFKIDKAKISERHVVIMVEIQIKPTMPIILFTFLQGWLRSCALLFCVKNYEIRVFFQSHQIIFIKWYILFIEILSEMLVGY